MVRRSSFVIGLGLALLWGIGLRLSPHATMLWFDAVAAVIAFSIAILVDDRVEHDPGNALAPALLGLGLAALWIIGIAGRQAAWVAWVQFPFAVACLAVAVVAAGARHVELGSRARTYRVT
jgi:NO-binding membrane sensor protein with MHYT domain